MGYYDPETIRETIENLMAAFVAAFIGRFAKHVLLVQKGIRRLWGAHLFFELPVAILMGFVGSGLADWLVLSPRSGIGLIAALSYLGPAVIERIYSVNFIGNKNHKD